MIVYEWFNNTFPVDGVRPVLNPPPPIPIDDSCHLKK